MTIEIAFPFGEEVGDDRLEVSWEELVTGSKETSSLSWSSGFLEAGQ